LVFVLAFSDDFLYNLRVMPHSTGSLSEFIARWKESGAAERANCQPFLGELCDVLGVPRPEPAQPLDEQNAYVFERAVTDARSERPSGRLRPELDAVRTGRRHASERETPPHTQRWRRLRRLKQVSSGLGGGFYLNRLALEHIAQKPGARAH
jgi:hypothetical protein